MLLNYVIEHLPLKSAIRMAKLNIVIFYSKGVSSSRICYWLLKIEHN